MPSNDWSDVSFPPNRVWLMTARQGYQALGAYVSASRIAGEDGAEVDFSTPGGAQCHLTIRDKQAVVDLITALQKAIDHPV